MLYGYDDWDGVQYDTFYDPSPFSWDNTTQQERVNNAAVAD